MFKNKFKNRSITETLTAGDCLKRKRLESGLSTKEIGEKLGIKAAYLDSLENGDHRNLPPEVYVRGFIRSYSNFLGLDADQVIKIYNREMSFREDGTAKSKKKHEGGKKFDIGNFFVITPKLLTFIIGLVVLVAFGYYALHQINSFNSKPYLFVESPIGDSVVNDKNITVTGKTEKDASLEINGQEVSVGPDGSFQQDLVLSAGRNLLVVEAKNRFNKTEIREINIVYEKTKEENAVIEEMEEVSDVQSEESSGSIVIEEETTIIPALSEETAEVDILDVENEIEITQ